MPKKKLRDALLTQRQELPAETRRELSRAAQKSLIESLQFENAECIALYCPTRGEVETDILFDAARRNGKRVCYPRVEGERMVFVQVDELEALTRGAFGVFEPQRGVVTDAGDLDMMVVPGIAFDRTGHRLGYGKGFYDRELHSVGFSGVLIGLCFDFQLLDRLPSEQHDIPVAHLVTELGLFSPSCSSDASGSP